MVGFYEQEPVNRIAEDVSRASLLVIDDDASVTRALTRMLQHEHDVSVARRVVFLTGGAFTPAARQFLASTANSSLEKPIDPRDLRAAVSALMK